MHRLICKQDQFSQEPSEVVSFSHGIDLTIE